jgi:hypothetical protein
MIPPLVHFFESSLNDGRDLLPAVHLAEDLSAGGRQRQEVLPLSVDLQLQILKLEANKPLKQNRLILHKSLKESIL